MARQRTLFIVPSLRRAGAENQIVQLVNGLSAETFEKHLLWFLPEDDLLPRVNTGSVMCHPLRRQRKIDLAVAREIGKIIDENQIDIVHCTLENALLYGMLGVRYASHRSHLICAIHTTKQASLKHKLADHLLYRHLLKNCAQVWFMCNAQATLWIERMPYLAERKKIIHNGIEITEFDPNDYAVAGRRLRERFNIGTEAKIVCCVAGMRPEKNHDVLLRAFKNVCAKLPGDCYLLLAGSGPMDLPLRKLAQQLGIQSRVVFLGELADVRPLLAVAVCKVLASRAETFSMAMLEAMAMQVPVISTRVGGASEAIRDRESGLLISPGDVNELAESILWLLSDETRRNQIGCQARQSVAQNFTYSTMVEKSSACLLEMAKRICR